MSVPRWDGQQQGDWSPYWDPESTMTMPHLPVADGHIPGLPAGQISRRKTPAPSSGNWLRRVLSELRNPLYRGGYLLVANTAGTSIIGAAYWAVAARLYGPEALGRATALVSALMLVATLSQLNLSSTLTRFLPQLGARSAGRLIKHSYLGSMVTALAGGLIFVVVAPRLSSQWDYLGNSYFLSGLFILAVIVWELFTLQDAALVGLQRAGPIPIENAIYGVLKLALLVAGVVVLHSTDVLASWTAPLILLIPIINWLMFRRYLPERDLHDRAGGLKFRRVARFASVDYAGLLFSQITGNFIPLLVMSTLGATANGTFYIAGIITSGAVTVGLNFSTGLVVEGSASPERLAQLVRGVLRRCLLTMVPATIVLVLAARPIASIYGAADAANTAALLRVLAISLVPCSLYAIAFSVDRIHARPVRATLGQLALCVMSLAGSWLLLGRYGVLGVAVACVGADVVVALVRIPTIVSAIRPRAAKAAADWAMPPESALRPGPARPAQPATPPKPPRPATPPRPAPPVWQPGLAGPAQPAIMPAQPASPPGSPWPAQPAAPPRPPLPAQPAGPPQPARAAHPARPPRPPLPAQPASPQPHVPAGQPPPQNDRHYSGRHRAAGAHDSEESDGQGEPREPGGPWRTVRA